MVSEHFLFHRNSWYASPFFVSDRLQKYHSKTKFKEEEEEVSSLFSGPVMMNTLLMKDSEQYRQLHSFSIQISCPSVCVCVCIIKIINKWLYSPSFFYINQHIIWALRHNPYGFIVHFCWYAINLGYDSFHISIICIDMYVYTSKQIHLYNVKLSLSNNNQPEHKIEEVIPCNNFLFSFSSFHNNNTFVLPSLSLPFRMYPPQQQ